MARLDKPRPAPLGWQTQPEMWARVLRCGPGSSDVGPDPGPAVAAGPGPATGPGRSGNETRSAVAIREQSLAPGPGLRGHRQTRRKVSPGMSLAARPVHESRESLNSARIGTERRLTRPGGPQYLNSFFVMRCELASLLKACFDAFSSSSVR